MANPLIPWVLTDAMHPSILTLMNATEKLLAKWTEAREYLQASNSQAACAAILFIQDKIDRQELTVFAVKADDASHACDAAERAYRDSYRK